MHRQQEAKRAPPAADRRLTAGGGCPHDQQPRHQGHPGQPPQRRLRERQDGHRPDRRGAGTPPPPPRHRGSRRGADREGPGPSDPSEYQERRGEARSQPPQQLPLTARLPQRDHRQAGEDERHVVQDVVDGEHPPPQPVVGRPADQRVGEHLEALERHGSHGKSGEQTGEGRGVAGDDGGNRGGNERERQQHLRRPPASQPGGEQRSRERGHSGHRDRQAVPGRRQPVTVICHQHEQHEATAQQEAMRPHRAERSAYVCGGRDRLQPVAHLAQQPAQARRNACSGSAPANPRQTEEGHARGQIPRRGGSEPGHHRVRYERRRTNGANERRGHPDEPGDGVRADQIRRRNGPRQDGTLRVQNQAGRRQQQQHACIREQLGTRQRHADRGNRQRAAAQ